jgi:hypothetical protein
MSMTYAHISDPVVLADYRRPATRRGCRPLADTFAPWLTDQTALDWLKTNLKTELELTLSAPSQEGP